MKGKKVAVKKGTTGAKYATDNADKLGITVTQFNDSPAMFQEVKNEETPIIVERIVDKIDEIVRIVRFDGWQSTSGGEREVKKALRRVLLDFKLHGDQELFDRAYGYIRQYY